MRGVGVNAKLLYQAQHGRNPMLAPLDLDQEILLELSEVEKIHTEWNRLNELQKQAYKMSNDVNNTDKSTDDCKKELGCHKYEWEKWNKLHSEHVKRLHILEAIKIYKNIKQIPMRPEPPRGLKY